MSSHFSLVRRDPSTAAAIGRAAGAWRRALDAFAGDVPVEVVALADMFVRRIDQAARRGALPDAETVALARRLSAHIHKVADIADAEAAFASGRAFHGASRRQAVRALAAGLARLVAQMERLAGRVPGDRRANSSLSRAQG